VATETARKVSRIFEQNKRIFDTTLFAPNEAIALWTADPETSLLCADVQDNPGAGASSDTVGFLRALVRSDVDRAVVGLICDPEFVEQAITVGIDGVFSATLGGKSGIASDTPLMGRYRVDLLKDGVCYNTGEMYRGCISELGQSVKVTCLDAQGSVTAIVTSNPIQCLDQAHFTYFDVDLKSMQIIGVKSTLHYRADFEHLVDRVVSVASAGQFPCVLTPNTYSKLPKSMMFL
jgi:microcystin degradation protein MlrC